LRTIAFWGADLADAGLFRQVRKELAPFRTEVRDLRTGHPVVSVGSRGEVTFQYDGIGSLNALLKVISFLTEKGMIDWPEKDD
jgi:hypothetical protein